MLGVVGLAGDRRSRWRSPAGRRAAPPLPGWSGTPALLADAVARDRASWSSSPSCSGWSGSSTASLLVVACLIVGGRGAAAGADADPGAAPASPTGAGTRSPTSGRRRPRAASSSARRPLIALVVAAQWAGPDAAGARPRHLRRRLALVPPAAGRAHRADGLGHRRCSTPTRSTSTGSTRRSPSCSTPAGLLLFGNDFLSPLLNLGWLGPGAVRGLVHRPPLRRRRRLDGRRGLGDGRQPALLAPAGQRQQRRRRDRAVPLLRRPAAQRSLAGHPCASGRPPGPGRTARRPARRGARRRPRAGHEADGRPARACADPRRHLDQRRRPPPPGRRGLDRRAWWSAAATGTCAT